MLQGLQKAIEVLQSHSTSPAGGAQSLKGQSEAAEVPRQSLKVAIYSRVALKSEEDHHFHDIS